jgi:RimJ/RimL family protein N-acetyltransferase
LEIPVLETERLRLRGWQPEDLAVFTRMNADPEVTRHLGEGRTLDAGQTWRACAALIGHWTMRGYGQWIAEEKTTGTAMGRIGLYHPVDWPGLEVGWTLAREHWGRGYATEGARAALGYAFDVVRADTVISLVRPDNLRSIRVVEKLGGALDRRIEFQGGEALVYAYRSSSTSSR